MMLRMMDGVLGSICRDAFPGLAEVEANYVSPGAAQEAFFEAVDACNTEAVRKCLEEGGFDVGARNKSGWTALHSAWCVTDSPFFSGVSLWFFRCCNNKEILEYPCLFLSLLLEICWQSL